jgi:hypothetical protein
MKVNELIRQLIKVRDSGCGNYEVIMSKDSEGNSYSPCRGYFIAEGEPIDSCYWEIVDEDETKENNCVVLKPMN